MCTGVCKLSFTEEESTPEEDLSSEFPDARFKCGTGKNGALVQQFFNDFQLSSGAITLDLKDTPFQIQVWKALLSIPPAKLLSYQDIATPRIGRPGANRAVGTAIGNNPVVYLIPCHRAIRQTGEMGGYRWESERKIAINGYECAHF
jgi:AraC family transcriptional regulator of adaptative response/methylated-DNA-[protein]-cysteine methyltransferase